MAALVSPGTEAGVQIGRVALRQHARIKLGLIPCPAAQERTVRIMHIAVELILARRRIAHRHGHDIDVIQWLAGAAPKRVSAMGRLSVYNRTTDFLEKDEKPDRKIAFKDSSWPPLEQKKLNPAMDVEDHNILMMELENGIQATYMHCMYTPDSERNYTFIGTKGRIENVGDYGESVQIHVWTQRGKRHKPDIVYNIYPREGGHGGSDTNIVPAFVDFVLDGKVPHVSPIDARNAVAAGAMGHYSMRHGSIPCDIPPVPDEWKEYFNGGQIG